MLFPVLRRIVENFCIIVPCCSISLWSSLLSVCAVDSCADLQFFNAQVFNNTLTAETGTQVSIHFSVELNTCNRSDVLRITVSRLNSRTNVYDPLCNIIYRQNACRNSSSGGILRNETIVCVCLETDGKYLMTMTVTENDFTKWQWSINGMDQTVIWFNKTDNLKPIQHPDLHTTSHPADKTRFMTHSRQFSTNQATELPINTLMTTTNRGQESALHAMAASEIKANTPPIQLILIPTGKATTISSHTVPSLVNDSLTTTTAAEETTSSRHYFTGILVGVATAITVLLILLVFSKKIMDMEKHTHVQTELQDLFNYHPPGHRSRLLNVSATSSVSENYNGKGVGRHAEVPHAMSGAKLGVIPTPHLFAPQNEGFEETTSQTFNVERIQDFNMSKDRAIKGKPREVTVNKDGLIYTTREVTVNKDGLIYTTLDLADSKYPSTFNNLRSTTYTTVTLVNDTFSLTTIK